MNADKYFERDWKLCTTKSNIINLFIDFYDISKKMHGTPKLNSKIIFLIYLILKMIFFNFKYNKE